MEDAFSGSHEDLENAAEQLYSSPPCPQSLRFETLSLKTPHSSPPRLQPLCFETLSLKTPQTVTPTPGTALQNRIENKLVKSLGSQLNIQLQQQMGFSRPRSWKQCSLLEMKSNLSKRQLPNQR